MEAVIEEVRTFCQSLNKPRLASINILTELKIKLNDMIEKEIDEIIKKKEILPRSLSKSEDQLEQNLLQKENELKKIDQEISYSFETEKTGIGKTMTTIGLCKEYGLPPPILDPYLRRNREIKETIKKLENDENQKLLINLALDEDDPDIKKLMKIIEKAELHLKEGAVKGSMDDGEEFSYPPPILESKSQKNKADVERLRDATSKVLHPNMDSENSFPEEDYEDMPELEPIPELSLPSSASSWNSNFPSIPPNIDVDDTMPPEDLLKSLNIILPHVGRLHIGKPHIGRLHIDRAKIYDLKPQISDQVKICIKCQDLFLERPCRNKPCCQMCNKCTSGIDDSNSEKMRELMNSTGLCSTCVGRKLYVGNA